MKIGIDAMGGDLGSSEVVKGAKKYLAENQDITIYLYGDKEELEAQTKDQKGIVIVPTTEVITTHDDPVNSIRQKKDSSLVVGAKDLKAGKLDAFISSGNTGAIVSSGIFIVGRLKNIERPALGGFFPSKKAGQLTLVLDVGANTEPKIKHMEQQALMGQTYIKTFTGKQEPQVALINIGAEETKGTQFYKDVHEQLKVNPQINFAGNLEPRYLFDGSADVAVVDGFTGNMLLKMTEGTANLFKEGLKEVFYRNVITKISALFLKSGLDDFRNRLDYKEVGATPLLGVKKLLLKAHGSSNDRAYYNSFRQAHRLLKEDFINKLEQGVINNDDEIA